MSQKKIRVYCPFMPYPMTEGAYQIMNDQIRVLSERNDVELVIWKENALQIAQKLNGFDPFEGRVKIICWGLESAAKESTPQRILRTLKSLLSAAPSPAEYYYPKSLDRRQQLGPCELAIYHYTYAWSWLSDQKITGESCQVIHLHNIESDLFDLRAQKETQPGISWIHKLNARKLRKIENRLVQYADQFWFVSQADREAYCLRYPMPPEKTKIRVPSYDSRMFDQRILNFRNWLEARSKANVLEPVRLGFVGTLDFDPNIMSLNWILDEVCPKLESAGWTGEITVVGRNASPSQIQKMAKYPFVKYLGFVKNMESFWQELSCFLVPHIEGSGVRVKLLDALASGVPVLANTAALDRIDSALLDDNLIAVADAPEAWTQKILSLRNHELRQSQLLRRMPESLTGESVYGDLR